ncbi:MAG: glutamate--tRNA ligase [Actinomycetota bacterium]
MTVRVRIAPAPSGSLHVGNVRTALFNWLFARHHGGIFILRVEDTDRARIAEEHFHAILYDLRWIGMDWDEGPESGGPYEPYRQSERLGHYADAASRLLELGAAFRCYCTREELSQRREEAQKAGRPPVYNGRCRRLSEQDRAQFETEGRPWTVRLQVPEEGSTSFADIVTGEVTFAHEYLDDVILVRSDGFPLYNLAAVVDDGIMKITHVVRGLDLQSSTPYQILMHEALGNAVPEYAHVPMINGLDGKPLSKRHGPTGLAWFRDHGFLPEAMMNYLAYLGWGTAEQELMSVDELIERFELEHVHASPATFDTQRLEWMNGEYIRKLDEADLASRLEPFLAGEGLISSPPAEDEQGRVAVAASLVQTRMRRLDEAPALVRGIFLDKIEPAPEEVEKGLGKDFVPELLEKAESALQGLQTWDRDSIESGLRGVVEQLEIKPRAGFVPFYVAIHGSTVGAPIFESMEVLGREKVLERLRRARTLAPASG